MGNSTQLVLLLSMLLAGLARGEVSTIDIA